MTYVAVGDFDNGQATLEQLSQLDPENPAVWRELGRIYTRRGQPVKSREAYARQAALAKPKP